jgi:hypothetical protein
LIHQLVEIVLLPCGLAGLGVWEYRPLARKYPKAENG